ncbi:hypothetical protein N431DRAFT_351213 [Stipitochalara longipes BDJ]|nr:hypothetical protein N431DRAFT_351213 [Stipitochalara longipes BDJ]
MTNILKNWDDNDSNNAYLRFFTPNATLNFGGPKVGRDAIRAARDSMIHPVNGPIVQCTHVLDAGFVNPVAAGEEGEIIVTGKVTYKLKDGRNVVCPVASLGKFVKGVDEGWYQADYYQVWMDTMELGKAIAEITAQS